MQERNLMTNLPPVLAIGVEESLIARVFLAIAIVIAVARLMGVLAKLVRQPPVVGEIIGGILLGPTLLGAFPGELDELLFPSNIRGFLTVIANLGLVIFMFIVGLELDSALIKGKERIAGIISASSIALPMTLGIILAIYLHRTHGVVNGTEVKLLPFALFIGAAMSITAFPVLARIMIDRGMYRTQIGALTLACAAVDDVLAWSMLAIVLAVVKTGSFLSWEFPRILALSLAFTAVMVLAVRPLLARLVPAHHKAGRLTPNLVAIVIGGILISSFVTSEIGIHQILGAFMFGAMMPRRDAHALNLELLDRIEQMTVVLLLPVFFVTTGLSVDIGALRATDIGVLLLILLTAVAGKFIGATVAARAQGIRPWRRAAAIGSLMNTRGLTELIILSVGREAGILDDRLFTMMVIMAVVTTVMTEPALRLFYPDRMLSRDVAAAQKHSLGSSGAYRVFVVVGESTDSESESAVDLACDIVGDERPSEVVLSRLVELGQTPELGGASARLADITASMDGLSALEQQVTASGIGARVLTRFSSEPMRDLIGQVDASDVDVLLLGASGSEHATATADELDRVVVVFEQRAARGDRRSVVLVAAEGDRGVASLELAVRIARSRAEPLRVVADAGRAKKWEAVVAGLEQRGIAASILVTGSDGADATKTAGLNVDLIVVAGGGPLPTSSVNEVLRVYTPPDMGRTTDDVLAQFDARDAAITATSEHQAAEADT
jgi:Kef-type K+ transport system membrane component KefB